MKLMRLKKCKAICLFIALILGVNKFTMSQEENKISREFKNSIKLRTTFGVSYRQYMLNPSYCHISKSHEYSIGMLYKDLQYEYLVSFNKIESPTKTYGVKLGYINNVKSSSGVQLRFETNLTFALTTAYALVGSEKIQLNDVYSVAMEFGPNLKIPIFKNVDLGILLQANYTYGFNDRSEFFFTYLYPGKSYLNPVYYFDINYKF